MNNKAKRSIRLEDEILRVSSNCSSVAASYLLSTNTATIGKSTICSLLKKEEPLINKSDIQKVCIDDFAIKKREKYGTIMVDINTHKVIDILESRELEQVTLWLKSFPNIEVVSRDGSITYRNAITLAHPQAIQVSD